MKYLILLYGSESNGPEPGTPEFGKMMAGYKAFGERLDADGIQWAGEALQEVSSATSITRRGGKVETMDGPFAETKEKLGGYYQIDVPDLDSALRYAEMIPAVDFGTIEIRPIMDVGPLLEMIG
ncbi:MAG: YciI family protein [Albidovulum sp.]|uniref:YciI family protein n=1 Tax=Albidovulum sp. TaxID=1872424 RepID=UPI003C88FF13